MLIAHSKILINKHFFSFSLRIFKLTFSIFPQRLNNFFIFFFLFALLRQTNSINGIFIWFTKETSLSSHRCLILNRFAKKRLQWISTFNIIFFFRISFKSQLEYIRISFSWFLLLFIQFLLDFDLILNHRFLNRLKHVSLRILTFIDGVLKTHRFA